MCTSVSPCLGRAVEHGTKADVADAGAGHERRGSTVPAAAGHRDG